MSAAAGQVQRGNNNTQQTGIQRIRQVASSCCTITKIFCIVLGVIALGQGWINARTACAQWKDSLHFSSAYAHAKRASYEEKEKKYRQLAKFKCDSEFDPSSLSFAMKYPDIAEFCKESLYPKDKIPPLWVKQYPEDNYLLGIHHFAESAAMAERISVDAQNFLKAKKKAKTFTGFVCPGLKV